MSTNHVRVRFAPSPTGYLHVGGARTALFNWLFARHHGGTFVLRIEDTDRQRSSPEMTQAILDGLRWLGLDWDEGPYFQTEGYERHRADVERLMQAGHAYPCFCDVASLQARRAGAEPSAADAYRYDRYCDRHVSPEEAARRIAAGEPHVIRFRVPPGETAWDDAVHGRLSFDNDAIEDFVVLRSDGTPVYNMAVVSDDVAHGITHVIRGDDHISNTPKQILLYRALGHTPPEFAHVPLILGPDGKRLSKRHGATAIGEYRERGVLPEAMINFLALLGWSPGTDEEVFDIDELVRRFTLEGINVKSAVFDVDKLDWLSGQHMNRQPAEALEPLVTARLVATGRANADALAADRGRYLAAIDLLKTRSRTVVEIADRVAPYLGEEITFDEGAVQKHWADAATVRTRLALLRDRLAAVAPWDAESLEAALRGLADELAIGAGKLIHPLRVALTGSAVSPGIFDVLAVMGRDLALRRIDTALAALTARAEV